MNNHINDKNYIPLTPFKGWVLENFPFIEADFDAITNYELLCLIVKYLNEVISNQNQVQELGTELVTAYNQLLDYVNNYFDNLDVQEEINNKLDQMVLDGSLTNIIKNYIDPVLEQQNIKIDNIEDLIHEIGNQTPIVVSSTSGMVDTTKIYVNTSDGKWYYYNGTQWTIGGTYQSTGINDNSIYLSMLQASLQSNFKAGMSTISGITWNAGGYYNGSGSIVSDANYSYSSKIDVNPKEIYLFPNTTGGQKSVVMFYNDTTISSIAITDAFNPFVIPDNVNKIVLNTRIRTDRTLAPTTLYKVSTYYLNGNEKIMYGDMDEAFQNSFIPEYEDITSNLTFDTGYWFRSLINQLDKGINAANFEYTSIDVLPGEHYKITGAYLGNVCLYQLVGGSNTAEYPSSQPSGWTFETKEITIPDGVYVLNVSGAKSSIGRGAIKIEKIAGYSFVGMDKSDSYDIKQLQKFNIEQQLKNDFKWSNTIANGKYATFTFDDSNVDISTIETLFENKNIPCCFATIPSKLNNITSSGETVKQVLQRAVTNGGEVLSHYSSPLTSASTDNDYINVYINTKKILEQNGFTVNGIITTGGTNYQTQDFSKDTLIARNNYLYADLTSSDDTTIEQYYNRRNFLTDTVANIKTLIDNYISGTSTQPYSKWLNFASHGSVETSISDIEEIIDYCLANNIQIVTWRYLYDHFKSSELEKRINQLEN